MSQEAYAAEQAALASYREGQLRGGRRQRVMGIDVTAYAGFKIPGIDSTTMFSDPICMLKDADERRKSGKMYLWKDPADPYTKSMCLRGVLRPVTTDELDPASPFANIDRVKVLTKLGPREVVRTPKGLGLFEAPSQAAMADLDKGLLPGKQWEGKYLSELAEQGDRFEADAEQLSASSREGRLTDVSFGSKDTAREAI